MRYQLKIVLFTIFLAFSLSLIAQAADMPGAPSELKLRIEGKGFLLTWNSSPSDPGIVTGYEVARATVASGPFKTVGKVKKGILKYRDRKAMPENIYYYKVRAFSDKPDKTYSPYSNIVTGELTGN
jgi:hypothetical protein